MIHQVFAVRDVKLGAYNVPTYSVPGLIDHF